MQLTRATVYCCSLIRPTMNSMQLNVAQITKTFVLPKVQKPYACNTTIESMQYVAAVVRPHWPLL